MMSPISKLNALLKKTYPRPRLALTYGDPWQLLVATILSAQCTDKRVNMVTPVLFKKFRSVAAVARADEKEFQVLIRTTGFYRNKAKNIIGAAKALVGRFGGKVPATMDELLTLPGVARKTANVVLHGAFGKNVGMAVDTHVMRVSQRLGLTRHGDPVRIEEDLTRLLDKKEWGDFSLRLIAHGRRTCFARKPACSACVLAALCPSRGCCGAT